MLHSLRTLFSAFTKVDDAILPLNKFIPLHSEDE